MSHFSIIDHPSSNFDLRPLGIEIDLIVIHYTDFLTSQEALDHLCDSKSRVSAHYLIDKGGDIYQLVKDDKRAWHAGISSWQGQSNINCRSIGIELDNGGHAHGLPPFPDEQISSLLLLLDHLCSVHKIAKDRIVGHSDVAPQRKKDPGEMFPWEKLSKQGYGFQITKPFQEARALKDIQQT